MDRSWSQTPDVRIIDACLDGNEKAWRVLVNRYKRLVYSIPIKWGLSPEDSIDIFQAVWLDCFRQLPSLRNVERLQPWLIRVAVHRCHRLTAGMRARGETAFAEDEMDEAWCTEDVAILFELDKEQLVRSALEKLTPRCRRVIQCLFFEEPHSGYQAIASRLALSESSIGFSRERCLNSLKRILGELGYEP